MKTIERSCWYLAFLGASFGHLSGAVGQKAEPSQSVTPEELIDDAIRKIETGDLNGAGALIDRVMKVKPGYERTLLARGLLLAEMKHGPEAIATLEQYNKTKDAGNEYRSYAALGRLYRDSKIFRLAVRPLEQAKDLAPLEENGRPVKANITIELASVLNKLTRTEEALKQAEDAGRLAPNDPEILLRMANIYYTAQNYPAAIQALDRSISLLNSRLKADPFRSEEHGLLKACYELKINVAQAQRAADPDDAMLLFSLAQSTREVAEVGRRIGMLIAREYMIEALNRDPGQHGWRVALAELEMELGALQDAMQHLNEVFKNEPNHPEASRLRDHIQAMFKSQSVP